MASLVWQSVSCFLFVFCFVLNSFHSHHPLNFILSFLGSCPVLLFFVLSFVAFPSAVNSMTCGLRHPSSKPFPKKVKRRHDDLHLLLLLLLLFLFPCPAPSCACVSANTGAWILWKSLQLSSEKSLEWSPFLQEEDIYFFSFSKFSITFLFNVCEEIPRSDQNCSTIEITENKLMRKKQKQKSLLFYLFQYLKEKRADVAHYFYLKYLLLQK